MNSLMFNLVLEKAEEPEIKLPTSTESWKKQESSRKNIYFCFIDFAKALDCVDHNKQWKILKEMGIPDYLTCPLRNLYTGQETTVRTGHGTTDWFQIGKGQFSFQSQRKAMPKNAQTTAQLHSSHMLVKSCSKFSKPGFSNT